MLCLRTVHGGQTATERPLADLTTSPTEPWLQPCRTCRNCRGKPHHHQLFWLQQKKKGQLERVVDSGRTDGPHVEPPSRPVIAARTVQTLAMITLAHLILQPHFFFFFLLSGEARERDPLNNKVAKQRLKAVRHFVCHSHSHKHRVSSKPQIIHFIGGSHAHYCISRYQKASPGRSSFCLRYSSVPPPMF